MYAEEMIPRVNPGKNRVLNRQKPPGVGWVMA